MTGTKYYAMCNRMADDNNTCDSIATVAQIALSLVSDICWSVRI